MRSHELAQRLLAHPDCEVVLQRDPEGNGYEICRGSDHNVAVIQGDYELEVFDLAWSADDCCLDEDEWTDVKQRGQGYVVLFP